MSRIVSIKTIVFIIVFIPFSVLLGCQSEPLSLFELIPSEQTGIDFENSLPEGQLNTTWMIQVTVPRLTSLIMTAMVI